MAHVKWWNNLFVTRGGESFPQAAGYASDWNVFDGGARATNWGDQHSRVEPCDAAVTFQSLPAGVVMLGSAVTVLDLDLDEKECYTLVLPQHADIDQQRISVLSPLGTALIGYREGDELTWPTPGGQRHLQIVKVVNSAA